MILSDDVHALSPTASDVAAFRDEMQDLWLLGILDEERIALLSRGNTRLVRAVYATFQKELTEQSDEAARSEQAYRFEIERFAKWCQREIYEGHSVLQSLNPQVEGRPSRLVDIDLQNRLIPKSGLLSNRDPAGLKRARKKAVAALAAYDHARDAREAATATGKYLETVRNALAQLVDRDLREQDPQTWLPRTVTFVLSVQWQGRRWIKRVEAPAIPPVGTVIALGGSTSATVTGVTLSETRRFTVEVELTETGPEVRDPMADLGFTRFPPEDDQPGTSRKR